MKWQTLIVVVAISFSVLSPLSVHLAIEHGNGQAAIGTFDVCHSGALAVYSGHEMPGFTEKLCVLLPPSSLSREENLSTVSRLPIIAFQDERPPKA
jgi:hypothetical protein